MFSTLIALIMSAQAQAQPAFEFRGFHARDTFTADDERFVKCQPIPTGQACALRESVMAGVPVHQIGVAFGSKGLYALEVKFRGDDKAVIEAALRSKYGAPCETRTEHPMNAFGIKFDRKVLTWCFSDGKAVFKSMTDKADRGSFEFATPDAASQAAAKDF